MMIILKVKIIIMYLQRVLKKKEENLILYCLIIFSIASFFMVCIFCFFYSSLWRILDVYNMPNFLLPLSLALSFSCIFYGYFRPISIMHSIYKSVLIVNLIYFLNGNKILYFHVQIANRKKRGYIILMILIETVTTIIFLCIHSIDDFYLFFLRNLIEHLVIFIIGVKNFLTNFINLYRQYRFERRIRAILTIAFKYKLIIYSKVFFFSFLYSLGFIILKFIQIKYNDVEDGFLFIYYMDISLEIFFAIILAIIFFPRHHSLMIEFEFYNKITNMNFLTEIKKIKKKTFK